MRRLWRNRGGELGFGVLAVGVSALAGWLVVYVSEPHYPDGPSAPVVTAPIAAAARPGASAERDAVATTLAARTPPASDLRVRVDVDAPQEPAFLCVDDAHGHRLFVGELTGTKTFVALHVRLNIGSSSVRVTVDGKPAALPESPTGLSITRKHGVRPLRAARRPCAS